MPTAVQAIIDAVVARAPQTEFVAAANHDNHRSQRLIRALGFTEDGADEIFSNPLQRAVTVTCFRLIERHVPSV